MLKQQFVYNCYITSGIICIVLIAIQLRKYLLRKYIKQRTLPTTATGEVRLLHPKHN